MWPGRYTSSIVTRRPTIAAALCRLPSVISFFGSSRRSTCVRLVLSSVAILFLEIFCFLMASASCHATTSLTACACASSKMPSSLRKSSMLEPMFFLLIADTKSTISGAAEQHPVQHRIAICASLSSCPSRPTCYARKRMNKIGILYGMETTFPPALVEAINSRGISGIQAESLQVGGVKMAVPSGYTVIIDRISQDIPFYRAFLKNAALSGARIINNPFWWSADDKFFNYALSSELGVATPRTVLLPHKQHPPDTTDQSMRNLQYPLDWDDVFSYVGFPAFLKPHSGGGWKHVYKVDNPDEFFAAYDQTGDLCMTLQQGIDFNEYFRCY